MPDRKKQQAEKKLKRSVPALIDFVIEMDPEKVREKLREHYRRERKEKRDAGLAE